jgi:hypothetical protein
MNKIDRVGLFKGEIKDFAVSQTRQAKLPQLVLTLLATEMYNEADGTWESWSEYEQTIVGYFVLVSLDVNGRVNKCLNYDQVMLATGWDGESYAGLSAMDLKGKTVQFRIQEDTYNNQTSLKVNWIDAEDAQVGLRKLSNKELSDLDAKFAVATPKPKPAAAKKAPAKAAPKPPTKTKTGTLKVNVESCTEDAAYQACVEKNESLEKPVPQEVLDDYWVTNVQEIVKDSENVTGEEWVVVRDAVIENLEIPF